MFFFSYLPGCFCSFFDVGEVCIGNMEFDLISFTLLPTLEVYNRCRKNIFSSIADFINISYELTKQDIKEQLFGELVKAGILWRFSTAWYGSVRFTFGGFSTGYCTWYFFSTTSAEVSSDPYRYQNVTCKLC